MGLYIGRDGHGSYAPSAFLSAGKRERVMTTPTAITCTTIAPSHAVMVLPGISQPFQKP